jgi:uncharacterized protein (TIGR03435 family)
MEQMVAAISGRLSAPIADQTGLTGTYDVNLIFKHENRKNPDDDVPGPTLEEALQAKLNLKLQKGKGSIEVLVIDHIEKPSAN